MRLCNVFLSTVAFAACGLLLTAAPGRSQSSLQTPPVMPVPPAMPEIAAASMAPLFPVDVAIPPMPAVPAGPAAPAAPEVPADWPPVPVRRWPQVPTRSARRLGEPATSDVAFWSLTPADSKLPWQPIEIANDAQKMPTSQSLLCMRLTPCNEMAG